MKRANKICDNVIFDLELDANNINTCIQVLKKRKEY